LSEGGRQNPNREKKDNYSDRSTSVGRNSAGKILPTEVGSVGTEQKKRKELTCDLAKGAQGYLDHAMGSAGQRAQLLSRKKEGISLCG